MNDLKRRLSTEVFEKADEIYLNIVVENSHNKAITDTYLQKDVNDRFQIKEIMDYLQEYKIQNTDWLSGIGIYFEYSDLFIDTDGVIINKSNDYRQNPVWFQDIVDIDKNYSYVRTNMYQTNQYFEGENIFIFIKKYNYNADGESSCVQLLFKIRESYIRSVMKNSVTDDGNIYTLCDDKGNIISSTREGIVYPCTAYEKDVVEKMNSNRESTIEYTRSGEKQLVDYSVFPLYNWYLVSENSRKMINKVNNNIAEVVVLICIFAMVIGVFFSGTISKRWYNPIQDIIKMIRLKNISEEKQLDDEYGEISTAIQQLFNKIGSLEETIENNIPLIKKDLVIGLMTNTIRTMSDFGQYLDLIEREFEGKKYLPVIFKISTRISNELDLEQYNSLIYNLVDVIESLSTKDRKYIATEYSKNKILFIAAYSDVSADIKYDIEGILQYIYSNFSIIGQMIIGDTAEDPLKLHNAFKTLQTTLKCSIFSNEFCVIDGKSVNERKNSNENVLMELIQDFSKQINAGHKDESIQAIHSIIEKISGGDLTADYCNMRIMEILFIISSYMNINNIKTKEVMDDYLYSEFETMDDINMIEDWLINTVTRVFENIRSITESKNTAYIDMAVQYISENFHKDISLSVVAEKLHFSPQYLSKMFKDEKGVSFSEYLAEIRLKQAVSLLVNTDENIDKIAASVGYNTTHYFIKKFKERYGITPKKYRLKH